MTAGLSWHDAAACEAVREGAPLGVVVAGIPVALFRLGEAVHALHDRCQHGAARLSDGVVENGCVECPLHQGLIDIASGAPRSVPIRVAVRVYRARIAGARVEIALPQQDVTARPGE